jgi:glycerol-3-phosphate acyltransferase PlsY
MDGIISVHADALAHTGLPPALIACILAGCYFIGNINPAILIGRAHGVDVRSEGSGNAGMTNAMRTIGKRAGVMTFVIDVLKGFLPTLAAAHFANASLGMLCGILVAVGHIWPVVYRFRGGKGVSTCFGVMLAFDAKLALILLVIVVAGALATKRVSAGTLIACACALPLTYLMNPSIMPAMAAVIALVVIGHRSNIVRLVKGTEPEMSFGRKES